MPIKLIMETPILKGEKGDKGDTGSFDYGHLEEVVDEHLDNRFADVDASLDLKVDKEVGKSLVDDEYIAKFDNLETLDKTVVEKFNDKVEQKDFEENVIQMKSELQNYINENLEISKSGDMQRFVYDNDFDGIVERADRADNADNADKVNNLTVETAVPPNAFDLVTVEKDGLMSFSDKLKLNGIQSGANYTQVIDNLESVDNTKALSANQGKILNEKINSIYQTLLFNGATQTGSITLSDSIFNYKYLIINTYTNPTGSVFQGTIFPILQNPTASQGIIFGRNFNTNAQAIYTGVLNYSTSQPNTLEIEIEILSYNHTLNSTGAHTKFGSQYIRQIYGVK